MFDAYRSHRSHRSHRSVALLPVTVSILMLSWACGTPDQTSEQTSSEQASDPAPSETSDPPPRSDTITALTQFLSCNGNPYALCYYSGPEDAPPDTAYPVPALPCELDDSGLVANCTCYALQDGTSTNYVALPSILNPDIRQATETACHEDGSGCLNMYNETRACADNPGAEECSPAPVCDTLGNVASGTGQTMYPESTLISTFSTVNSERYPINSTNCSDEPYLRYAGCMTAGCGEPYTDPNGESLVDCSCPTYVGPFQFGQMNSALECDLGNTNVWSAANVTFSLPGVAGSGASE